MDNAQRTLEDLLLDDLFVRWVTHPTPALDRQWKEWQAHRPDRAELVEKARFLIQETQANQNQAQLTDQEVQSMWHQLQNRHQQTSRFTSKARRAVWLRVAASATGLLLMSALVFWWIASAQTVSYQTAYGETKKIILPDSSTVMLNANSSLSYEDDWNRHEDRKVILEGEAYFDVQHTRNHRKFLVQTNAVTVEVLGTTFNVNQRRGKAQVVLSTGKVTLYPPNKAVADHITMQPGDLVELDTVQYIQKQVNTAEYTAWTSDELVFNGTTVADIAQMLEDNYGLHIVMTDTTLAQKRFHGRVASDNVEALLGQMEKVFQLTIERRSNKVVLHPRQKRP
uniref:FecR domain-containing protein n=1 Tax=Roseihalotalea indica TaxID=2867963 RepID=A0AA49GGC1_9BACT|nr:FecR domain-containing protein [Tunicatimonas sp. TK19036]